MATTTNIVMIKTALNTLKLAVSPIQNEIQYNVANQKIKDIKLIATDYESELDKKIKELKTDLKPYQDLRKQIKDKKDELIGLYKNEMIAYKNALMVETKAANLDVREIKTTGLREYKKTRVDIDLTKLTKEYMMPDMEKIKIVLESGGTVKGAKLVHYTELK